MTLREVPPARLSTEGLLQPAHGVPVERQRLIEANEYGVHKVRSAAGSDP